MSSTKQRKTFAGMLGELVNDPKKAALFRKDPEAAIAGYKLSADQKKRFLSAVHALKAGKTTAMRKVVADEMVHPDTCFCTIP